MSCSPKMALMLGLLVAINIKSAIPHAPRKKHFVCILEEKGYMHLKQIDNSRNLAYLKKGTLKHIGCVSPTKKTANICHTLCYMIKVTLQSTWNFDKPWTNFAHF